VDIEVKEDGKVYFKPNSGYSYEYSSNYISSDNDQVFSNINPGYTVKNAKKVVIFVENGSVEYLYYEVNDKTTTLDGGIGIENEKECSDADDCQQKYGSAPHPFNWVCDDGTCKLGM